MRGRPVGSKIRERIALILSHVGVAHGYQIFKLYKKYFGLVEPKSIYYNLHKGVDLGEFVVCGVRTVSGTFSWGGSVRRVYYTLGPFAKISNEHILIREEYTPPRIPESEYKRLLSIAADKTIVEEWYRKYLKGV